MLGVLLDRQWQRERKKAEREKEREQRVHPLLSLQDFAASCLTASKTIRPFFLPFTPLKESDSGTQHNI